MLYLLSAKVGYLLGEMSYSAIARRGDLGSLKAALAWIDFPWHWIRFKNSKQVFVKGIRFSSLSNTDRFGS